MLVIVKLHPEIFVKSRSLRKRHLKLLVGNIRQVMKRHGLHVIVENRWDRLTVEPKQHYQYQLSDIITRLQTIPGIDQLQTVKTFLFHNLSDAAQIVVEQTRELLTGKLFFVRVKRKGDHEFSSVEAGREFGGRILREGHTAGVSLKSPEVTVDVVIDQNQMTLIDDVFTGMGGYPLPAQGNALSLISGGFDSAVASYQMLRRGTRLHYCFFSLSGIQHEIAVKHVVSYLWKEFSSSHKSQMICINFEPLVNQILERVDNAIMGVVLKRMMLKAAAQVAQRMQVDSIVTGESIGQVSSQTMANLSVIDQVTEQLILRPLICSDKQAIIDVAREIGVEDLVKSIPEYCGVISQKPSVAANLDDVIAAEATLDDDILEQVLSAAERIDVSTIDAEAHDAVEHVNRVETLPSEAVVIDVRGPLETENAPLVLATHDVMLLPFYKLQSQFASLDPTKAYYLYCDRGVMSQLQAVLLKESGFDNVHVYEGRR